MQTRGRLLSSAIGRKVIMALSGIGLIVCVTMHRLGNVQIFFGREAFHAYAATLKALPLLLWGARAGLFACFAGHMLLRSRTSARICRLRSKVCIVHRALSTSILPIAKASKLTIAHSAGACGWTEANLTRSLSARTKRPAPLGRMWRSVPGVAVEVRMRRVDAADASLFSKSSLTLIKRRTASQHRSFRFDGGRYQT